MTIETFGLVLAGGLARRMGGGDKALIRIGGETILQRALARLTPQVDGIVLNANGDPARFASFGLPVVADSVPDFAGPLAGILAGLDWVAANRPGIEWIVSVPGDCPFLPRDLVARAACGAHRRNGKPLACAHSGDWRHPVVGLWQVALREDLRHAITVEDLRKIEVWTARHGVALADWPTEPVDPFFNVNTPEDVEKATQLAASRRGLARQHRIRQEADRLARRDLGHVVVEFGEPVGCGQRRDHARAVLRMLGRLIRAIRARASATRAHIRAGLSSCDRQSPTRPAARSAAQARRRQAAAAAAAPRARRSRTPRPDCPAGRRTPCPRSTPIATGRPGLIATRQNTSEPPRRSRRVT